MPMMPQQMPPDEEQMMAGAPPGDQMAEDPMMAQMAGPEMGPPPADPGMGPGPMMDEPEPAPEEIAMMIGSQIAAGAEQAHMMVEQAKQQQLEQVMGMIAQAAEGAQVMGPGQIA